MQLIGSMMAGDEMDGQMATELLDVLLGHLKDQDALLATHPNSYVYGALGSMLEIDGHFLESEPLHASNQPELPSQQVKLDALKAETKFTESCQIVKFAGSNTIHSGVLRISDIRRTASVSSINLYCNNKPVNDVGELKNKWELWKKVKTLQVPPQQAEIRFEFTIPVVATNLLIEYATFHDQLVQSEKLQCPRCSRTVTDKHGICKHCGDNAYQCRHCRNINYEKLDAFLCNECGFCKHARFDYTLVVKPSYVVERITNEAEREKLLGLIDSELQNANKRHSQLATLKRPLERLLAQPSEAILQLLGAGAPSTSVLGSAGAPSSVFGGAMDTPEQLLNSLPGAATLRIQRKITILAMLYCKESKAAYESLSKSAQVLQAARTELLRYLQANAAAPQPRSTAAERQASGSAVVMGSGAGSAAPMAINKRFDCASAYVLQCLALLESTSAAHKWVREVLISRALPVELFEHHLCNVPSRLQSQAIRLICLLCENSASATESVGSMLAARLELCLGNFRNLPHDNLFQAEVQLLCELASLQDPLWPHRLQQLFRVFFRGIAHRSSSLVCERLVLPCLRLIARLFAPTGAPAASASSATSAAGGGAASGGLGGMGALSSGGSQLGGLQEPVPSALPVSLRAPGLEARLASDAEAAMAQSRRISGMRALLSPQLGLGGASSVTSGAASAALGAALGSTRGGSAAPAAAAPPAAASLPTVRKAEGAAVRIDRWMLDPAEYDVWKRRAVTPPGAKASASASVPAGGEALVEGVGGAGEALPAPLRRRVLRLGRRWHAKACLVGLPLVAGGAWLFELLLCESSQAIREESASLLGALAERTPSRAIGLLDLLIGMLPAAVAAPRCAAEYFDLLRQMMAPQPRRLYLVVKGLLGQLCSLIGDEARRLREQEDLCANALGMIDMAQGYMLKVLIEMLHRVVELPTVAAKFRREAQLPVLLHALLCVRGLVMQKTSITSDCATRLSPLLASLHEGSENDRRRFMAACVASMTEHASGRASDGRSLIFLAEQLCSLVCPEKPEPEYKLMLNKTSTQEEFIRGAMVKNPYSSKAVGPLMRDVKNKICRDLDLGGLIEDDNGMELLVAGQIVKLDLTVAAVYEQVWARSAAAQGLPEGNSPMVVVYRLQGLDGEATEPIVETLDQESGELIDPEVEYAIAGVVGETGGLEVMMDILARSRPLLRVRECAALTLKLLQHCCKIRANRARMLANSGTQALLHILPEALEQESLAGVAERLLLTVESLLEEDLAASLDDATAGGDGSAPRPMEVESADGRAPGAPAGAQAGALAGAPAGVQAGGTPPEDAAAAQGGAADAAAPPAGEWDAFLSSLLTGLERATVRQQGALVKAITRLLPLVTRGEPALLQRLLRHYAEFADFDAYDEGRHSDERVTFGLECLVATLTSAKAASPLAQRVKGAVLQQGLASVAAAYLVKHIPATMDAGSQQWSAALGRPALPFVLQLLGGLAKGHVGVQQVLLGFQDASGTPELMTRLHALERQSSSASKAIGTLAESLLEALRERAAADVDRLRQATHESKRKAALDKRQRILQSMGMGIASPEKDGGGSGKVILAQTVSPAMLVDLDEETGHVCVVCGEGEIYRPNETMGCYAFCKRVPLLGVGGSGLSPGRSGLSPSAVAGGSEMCYTTVSHFNLIHFACHRDATRAERTLKQPKEEWEGACLRNSQTKCNNLLPIHGASVSEEAYAICVEQWWANLGHVGRVDSPRSRLVAHDVKLLLLRFSLEESFSTYSKGGGRESNMKMLPYLLQMGLFFVDARATCVPQRKALQRTLAAFVTACTSADSPAPSDRASDSPLYMMVLSLLLHTPNEWKAAKLPMLKRAVAYWRNGGGTRERFALAGPASPSSSPAIRPSRSPGLAPSRSPLEGGPSSGGSSGAALPPLALSPVVDGVVSSGGGGGATAPSSAGGSAAGVSPLPGGGSSVFHEVRPVLLYFALINQLQSILKDPRPFHTPSTSAGESSDACIPAMRERLQKHDQVVLKELLEMLSAFEEEMLPAGDAMEMFDALELLGPVLSEATSADAWLTQG